MSRAMAAVVSVALLAAGVLLVLRARAVARPSAPPTVAVSTHDDVDEAIEASARQVEANPRLAWRNTRGDVLLRQFKSIAQATLRQIFSTADLRATTLDSLQSEELGRTEFDATIASEGHALAVKGEFNILVFDRGTVTVVCAADPRSSPARKAFITRNLGAVLALVRANRDRAPATYIKLKGWESALSDPDDESSYVTLTNDDDDEEFPPIIFVNRVSPQESADAIRAMSEDPGTRELIRQQLEQKRR